MMNHSKINYTQLETQYSPQELKWKCKHYSELNVRELSLLVQFRMRVYGDSLNDNDNDGLDEDSIHIVAFDINEEYIYAYSRITPSGKKYSQPLITRLIAAKNMDGLKATLIRKTVNKFRHLYGSFPEAIAPDMRLAKEVSVIYIYSSGHKF